jgi:uncharacterized membrane protein
MTDPSNQEDTGIILPDNIDSQSRITAPQFEHRIQWETGSLAQIGDSLAIPFEDFPGRKQNLALIV